eukprot:jgi/Orpsp1_1/1176271/evm.model.c7180000057007.1
MSVIANELSNSLESFLVKVNKENSMDQTTISGSLTGSYGSFFLLDHEPTGAISSSPRYSSKTSAVSIPYSSKYRRSGRIRIGSTNSPSSSLSSTTVNGSLSHQSLKESLNKTISSIIENCQEKVIIHNSSPSSSYSFTKHSTIIYSPSKSSKSSLSTSFNKSKLSKNSVLPQDTTFSIKKIKPSSINKESKLSEISFGLKKEKPNKLRKSTKKKEELSIESKNEIKKKEESSDDTKNDIKKEQAKSEEIKNEDIKNEDIKSEDIKSEEIKSKEIKEIQKEKKIKSKEIKEIQKEVKELQKEETEDKIKISEKSEKLEKSVETVVEKVDKVESVEQVKPVEKVEIAENKSVKPAETIEAKPEIKKVEKKSEEKTESKVKKLAKLEAKKEKEMMQKKKATHKKTLSLPNILTPLTPLSGMEEATPPTVRKRRKSVNFSSDSFKSICIFTTTDKPESIKDAKVEVKIDDPESDKKDKEFSELRNYESAWSPVPRNVIHIQKFKSSKAKHVQYELPVSVQSFKLVASNDEETEDKLTCLKVTLNVQNLNYEKKVVIRYTVNKWKTFKEVEAKYVKCIREATKEEGFGIKGVVGLDRFVARIPVGEHFVLEEKPGHICNQRPTKMLLVARYEVNNNTYWDNNDFTDYHIELVRINAGYDVPRVSKHGKPIPCPGCCMSGKQNSNSMIENSKGKDAKSNRRTVRKIGGVFGNFTEAVSNNNNDRTNFMADKKKGNLYMGMDGNEGKISSTTSVSNSIKKQQETREGKIVKTLTEEPQSIEVIEEKPKKKTVPKKKKTNSIDKMMRPASYNFGCSPSMGMSGSPMFSMLSSSSIASNTNTSSMNGSTSSISSYGSSSSIYGGGSNSSSVSSKYNPPVSNTSLLYADDTMGMSSSSYASSSNTGYSPYDISSHSKYDPSPYGTYDPSTYGGYPSSTTTTTTTTTSSYSSLSSYSSTSSYSSSSSKYNPPNEYPENNFSKYDPPSYYGKRSNSSPLPTHTSSPEIKPINTISSSTYNNNNSSPYHHNTYSSSTT